MIVPKPTHHEQERLCRGDISPVHIVDYQHHRTALLEMAKSLQEFGPHRKRVGRYGWAAGKKRKGVQASRRHRPCQLPDNPLAEDGFLFVSTGLEDGRAILPADEVPKQRCLTESCVAFDDDDPGQASRCRVEGCSELLQLWVSTEEAAAWPGCRRGVTLRIHRHRG